ncbi:MAG TPA: pyridoxamine 5'-phosphate oxidase family protein [Clostridia bacterium]
MIDDKGLSNAIESAKKITESEKMRTSQSDILESSLRLVESCNIAMVGSNGDEGYPNIKAMIKVEAEGIKTVWFSTNTSSKRVSQFKNNKKASVYFADEVNFKGLMLLGDMEVLSDIESKKRLWSEGCEIYYPLGVEDPDYSVLRFTAKKGNYYHGLKNVSFDV